MATKATKQEQQFERELTGIESLICMVMLVVVCLLVSIDERIEWHAAEWVRMALALVLGFGTCVWQYKRMHTPLKDKEA